MEWFRVQAFAEHIFYSKSIYQIHSPFVYTFCKEILPHKNSKEGIKIAALKKKWENCPQKVHYEDLGAGSSHSFFSQILHINASGKSSHSVPIKRLVQKAARKRREGELLYRICKYYKPKRCLELGTHIGISALYQLSGLPKSSKFVSVEGSQALAELAKENIYSQGFNPKLYIAEFDHFLSDIHLLSNFQPDYVFLDGNHQFEATIRYVKKILPYMPNSSILILDDINWSKGMKKAWEFVLNIEEVSVSIDLFTMGICFIRRKQVKEHFKLRLY